MKKAIDLLLKRSSLIWIIALFAIPFVVDSIYYLHLINYALILIILTVGLNLLTGFTGQISIGHAGFYGIGAYVSAYLSVTMGLSFWLAFPLSGIITALIGYLIGRPILKLKGAYLSIASIGIGEITRLVLINWTEVTRGAEGFKGIPAPVFFGTAINNDMRYYWLLVPIVILVYTLVNTLIDSEAGRAFRAIRDEEIAAEFMGVNVAKLKVMSFSISSFLAGIAGSLLAHMDGYLSPFSFNFTQSVSYLMMVLAGGLGCKWGPIVGVFLLTFAKEWFRFFNEYQLIIYGLMLVLIIIFMPKGVCGSLKEAFLKMTHRRYEDGR
jgi:branched-chain amino acid transport system permease protein